jgi:hypothetical protein
VSKVLILDGEELEGAKQDRIVNATILPAAHSTLVIPVSGVFMEPKSLTKMVNLQSTLLIYLRNVLFVKLSLCLSVPMIDSPENMCYFGAIRLISHIFPPNPSFGRMNQPKRPCLIIIEQGLSNSGELAAWIRAFEASGFLWPIGTPQGENRVPYQKTIGLA